MSASNFESCARLVMQSEGGNVDNPKDPGGRTGRGGITQRTYDAVYGPGYDVFNIKDGDIYHIYQTMYWNKVFADILPRGLDYAVFDCAIMHGPGNAVRLLQQTMGVTVDGIIGQKTLNAVLKISNALDFIHSFEAWYLRDLQLHADWKDFGEGWAKRLVRVETDAKIMADNPPIVSSMPTIDGIGLGPLFDHQTKPINNSQYKDTKKMGIGSIFSNWFSGEVMNSLERKALAILGTWVMAHSVVTSDQWTTIGGAIAIVVSIVTGMVTSKQAATNSQTVASVGLIPNMPADKQPNASK